MIYETLNTPNGLMFDLRGLEEGRCRDVKLYRKSGWENILDDYFCIYGEYFYMYGYLAYLVRPSMKRPCVFGMTTTEQHRFKQIMSAVRTSDNNN